MNRLPQPRSAAVFALAALVAMLQQSEAATFSDEVSRLATPLVDASRLNPNRAVGLVVVVVTRHGIQVFDFGANRAGEATAPDGDTYFQIGSVSKSLTGLLLASTIEGSAGTLNAGDGVNAHLAPDPRAPDFQRQPVMLGHLAKHYGSLPDMPNNLTGPPTSPAQNDSRTQLATYLSTLTLGTTIAMSPPTGFVRLRH
jgi:CubicO group peptidase (beta-lactamase class C family)